ncbi:MAG: flagellar protein FliS [Alphaproteobacteria bacterium]|nr:flagellar protein FliS [Alphaproteobacteria bacterium]
MSPTQHRIYKRNTANGGDVTENMALLLEQVAVHMKAAHQAIISKDVEKRFKESERASFILAGLKGALVRLDTEQAKTADGLQRFYDTMETLIMRMNIFNSAETAKSLEENFLTLAQKWRQVGQQSNQSAFSPPPAAKLDEKVFASV